MVEISVTDFASRYALSVSSVRAAAARGLVDARRVAGVWLIDDRALLTTSRGRPLSARSANALTALIDRDPTWDVELSPTERSRVRARLALLSDDAAAGRLVAWFRGHAAVTRRRSVAPSDLDDLLRDSRVVPGGVSDPRAGMSAPGFAELHVAAHDVEDLEREYLLRSSDRPNVLLHVDEHRPDDPLPLSALVLDLARSGGDRERAQVGRLLARTK